jgi:hypothetical protein
MGTELALSLVGGFFALLGTALGALSERSRSRQEGLRRDGEWRRDQCNHAYSEAIYYLFKLQVSSASSGLTDKDVRQHLSEAQRYLSLLRAYVPDASVRSQLSRTVAELTALSEDGPSLSDRAKAARSVVENSLQSLWAPSIRSRAPE